MLDLGEMLEKHFGSAIITIGSCGSGRIAVLTVAAAPVADRVGRCCSRTAARMVETA